MCFQFLYMRYLKYAAAAGPWFRWQNIERGQTKIYLLLRTSIEFATHDQYYEKYTLIYLCEIHAANKTGCFCKLWTK